MFCFGQWPEYVDTQKFQRLSRRKQLEVIGVTPFLDTKSCATLERTNRREMRQRASKASTTKVLGYGTFAFLLGALRHRIVYNSQHLWSK